MKKLLLILVASLTAAPALAQSRNKAPVVPQNPFIEEYMQCKKLRAAVKQNPKAELGCNAKVNLEYCDKLSALPAEIQEKIGLELQCEFLGGELTGDATTDKDIDALSTKIGCPLSSLGTVHLLRKNWGNEKNSRALLFFVEEFVEAESKCLKEVPENTPKNVEKDAEKEDITPKNDPKKEAKKPSQKKKETPKKETPEPATPTPAE